jgi:hypothetical protein
MKKILLTLELVPSSSWMSNVRAVVTKKQWDYIKSQVSSKAYNVCEICGNVGPKHPVECHEIWSYSNKKLIQNLEGMIALCPACHMVKHIGFAEVQGKRVQAVRHLMFINKMTMSQAEDYIKQSFKVWHERSQKSWTLDLSHLKEYGIDITKIRSKE